MSADPIIRQEAIARFDVAARRPVPSASTCLVFVDSRGGVIVPDGPLGVADAIFTNLRRLYEIDLSEHAAKLSCRLPCQERGFHFDVALRLRWRVERPDQIVRDGRHDVTVLYEEYLRGRVLAHGEAFSLERRDEAERKLASDLGHRMSLPEGIAITGCAVAVSLPARAEKEIADRTTHKFELERADRASASRLKSTRHRKVESTVEDELARQLGEQRAEHRRRQERQSEEIRAMRREQELVEERHRQELDRARADHETAIADRELEARFGRMEKYQAWLDKGSYALILMFLENNPGDVDQLINLAVSQRREHYERSRELLQTLFDSGMASAADAEPGRRRAIENIVQGLGPAPLDGAMGPARPPEIGTIDLDADLAEIVGEDDDED